MESSPDDSPSPGSAWTAGQVAQHLGISESTLRTWHRRYGLDPDGAQPGRYRRYRPADVARLRRMLELIGLGMLASEAARVVQSGAPGTVSAVQEIADLIDAARAVDTDQRQDPDCIDVEHTLSWAMLTALSGLPRPPADPGATRILLACTDGEQHTLPLAALAAALAEHRVPARMLGAANPTPSLVRAVRDARPETIVLWAQRPETAGADVLRALGAWPVRVVTAGPGWPSRQVPGIRWVATLPEAVVLLKG